MAHQTMPKYDEKHDYLNPVVSHQVGDVKDIEVQRNGSIAQDAVFGEITEGGPNYRAVGWKGTVALMMKTQIGLGVLSIPVVFDTLGMIPGIICLIAIAVITTWSDYVVGTFKLAHPEVYGIDDAGKLIFGKVGHIVLGTAFVLYWIFVAGSGMLSLSIGLNAVSVHGACTAIFVAVAAIAGFALASIRTLGKISPIAWVGLIGILSSILVLTIAVGVQDRPSAAPQEGPWSSDYHITNSPKFPQAISAIASLVFAYAGTPAFFSIVSEMRDPRQYTRSLIICQSGVTVTYITIGIVVYYFCGSYVASPALGSAGVLMKKICYGLALPGLLATTTLTTHLPAKYIFIKLLKGTKHLNSNGIVHWSVWIGCTAACAISSYVIASAIPVFGGLVSLIGALLGTLMSFQPMGFMWLYDNWSRTDRDMRWKFMVGWSVFVIVIGTFIMIAGTYGAVADIIDSYKVSGGSAAWTCADNSNSV
ncbi:Putative amino acid transporter, transmembrane domain-containing protein [Septoria linicola]|uniref:Amino acid transporter, transmembrane domain-containing protein n=1 Tax=Septoria linicola TaxID=215465 RepID=A0A9Q9B4G6_9PEZI|nr:Putative amino acid transporter, transmembrane domain-containing protein [Septoria linicola]